MQSFARRMVRSMATGSTAARGVMRRAALTVVTRLPLGQRTAADLMKAAVPSRLIVGMAVCALMAALAIGVMAKLFAWTGLTWLAAKAAQYAATFEAMPLWVLIGGAMGQFVARALVAFDDVRAWLQLGSD